jgi:hypothetical protein
VSTKRESRESGLHACPFGRRKPQNEARSCCWNMLETIDLRTATVHCRLSPSLTPVSLDACRECASYALSLAAQRFTIGPSISCTRKIIVHKSKTRCLNTLPFAGAERPCCHRCGQDPHLGHADQGEVAAAGGAPVIPRGPQSYYLPRAAGGARFPGGWLKGATFTELQEIVSQPASIQCACVGPAAIVTDTGPHRPARRRAVRRDGRGLVGRQPLEVHAGRARCACVHAASALQYVICPNLQLMMNVLSCGQPMVQGSLCL